MKALVLTELKQPLRTEDRPIPEAGSDQVRIRIRASGVCGTDIHVWTGELPVPLPIVLGHEPVGIIDSVGPGVTALRVGDRVGVSWFQGGCGRCGYCQKKQAKFCPEAKTWIANGGGHAEFMIAEAEGCTLLPDGLPCGDFTRVNGVARNSFARLNADGTLDLDFRPLVGTSSEPAWVYDTALQPDGKILIYGRLFKIDETYRHYLVRLNSDGTLDPGFNVDTNYEVEVLALQTDGKILIGSDFSTVGGVRRPGLARINTDGTLDVGFNPLGDYEQTYIIAPLRDGKIFVGGEYKEDRIGGSLIDGGLVQLNADGALDRDFNASVNIDGDGWSRGVWDIAIQADGKILGAGYFNSVNGISRTNLTRLLGQPANAVSVCCVSLVDGQPGFDITSSNARTVVVEGSTDLVNWRAIQTIPVGNVPVRFSDPDHANFSSRFYRASWQP